MLLHPHIVRKEAVGAGGRGGGGGKAAGERLSMRQIMAKLVAEAYAVYDQVRQQACVTSRAPVWSFWHPGCSSLGFHMALQTALASCIGNVPGSTVSQRLDST